MEKLRENRRLVLLVIVVMVMLCLLGVLAYNIFLPGGGDDVVKEPPTPTPVEEPTDDGPDVIITPDELTPTPTRVLTEELTPEPTAEPEEEEVVEEEPDEDVDDEEEILPEPTPTSTADDFTSPPEGGTVIIQIEELIENGDFSAGFDEGTGVGLEWNNFKTNGAVISFSPETAEPFIHSDGAAQRISVEGAFQTNQYAGLYQTVEVVPGETYTVTIHGQIRSGHGDVNQSGYGYRVQYAVDHQGGENWQTLTQTAWVEMPWGEELLNSSEVNFSEFSEQITAESDELTLFVRTWNKWAEPGLVE